jgi:hypothetical protein
MMPLVITLLKYLIGFAYTQLVMSDPLSTCNEGGSQAAKLV